MSELDTYTSDVINLGDDTSKKFYVANQLTWENRRGLYGEIVEGTEHFRGDRQWRLAPLLRLPFPELISMDQQTDGIGTKVLISQRTSKYDTAGDDLVAMTCDDAAARGYVPVVMTTDLQVNSLKGHEEHIDQLLTGMINAVKRAHVAVIGGETAVIGNIIRGYGNPRDNLLFSWSAAVHAVRHDYRRVDGTAIKPGMSIIGLKEPGFRSNGITNVRETLEKTFGKRWQDKEVDTEQGRRNLGQEALRGSVIYTPMLVDCIGGYDLNNQSKARIEGAAHITGGGLAGKLGDLLSVTNFGAEISDPYEVPEIMSMVLAKSNTSYRAGYRKLHMGQGMAIVTSEPSYVMETAASHGIDAKEIGEVTKEPGIRLLTKGNKPNKWLEFPAAA